MSKDAKKAKRSNYWPDNTKRRVTQYVEGLDNFDWKKDAGEDTNTRLKTMSQNYNKNRRVSRVTDTSFKTLESCWGDEGSFQVFPNFPKKTETEFATRKLTLWPKNTTEGGDPSELIDNWGIGIVNTKGCKGEGDNTIGQDSCSVSRLYDGTEVFCVMDGHGPDGHWPADRSVRTMPFFLQGDRESTLRHQGASDQALTEAFRKVQKDLEYWAPKEDIGLLTCGSTALCILHQQAENRLWVATAGDSRAVLIVPGVGVAKQTKDHKPSDPVEKRRLEEMGCDVEINQYDDGWTEERVYVKGERYPGLSMTRSLGDVIVEDKGVFSVPEVVNWSLATYDLSYVLLASDGVWEFMSSDEVAEFVLDGIQKRRLGIQQVAQELLNKSRDLWYAADPDYTDDITVVLVPLDGRVAPTVERIHETGCAAFLSKIKDCLGM